MKAGMLNRVLAAVMTLFASCTLSLGALRSFLDGDMFWGAVALWALALVLAPYLLAKGRDRPVISWLLLLTTLPYLTVLLASPVDHSLSAVTASMRWVLLSMALFSLSLVTVVYVDAHSRMDMNLNFALLTTLLLYESLVIIQGPIYYYSDLLLGTGFISGNAELMTYTVLATVGGLAQILVLNFVKRTELVEQMDATVEGGSS